MYEQSATSTILAAVSLLTLTLLWCATNRAAAQDIASYFDTNLMQTRLIDRTLVLNWADVAAELIDEGNQETLELYTGILPRSELGDSGYQGLPPLPVSDGAVRSAIAVLIEERGNIGIGMNIESFGSVYAEGIDRGMFSPSIQTEAAYGMWLRGAAQINAEYFLHANNRTVAIISKQDRPRYCRWPWKSCSPDPCDECDE